MKLHCPQLEIKDYRDLLINGAIVELFDGSLLEITGGIAQNTDSGVIDLSIYDEFLKCEEYSYNIMNIYIVNRVNGKAFELFHRPPISFIELGFLLCLPSQYTHIGFIDGALTVIGEDCEYKPQVVSEMFDFLIEGQVIPIESLTTFDENS